VDRYSTIECITLNPPIELSQIISIIIPNNNPFPCHVGARIAETESHIRKTYGLEFGGLMRDGGFVVYETVILEYGKYEFANFKSELCIHSFTHFYFYFHFFRCFCKLCKALQRKESSSTLFDFGVGVVFHTRTIVAYAICAIVVDDLITKSVNLFLPEEVTDTIFMSNMHLHAEICRNALGYYFLLRISKFFSSQTKGFREVLEIVCYSVAVVAWAATLFLYGFGKLPVKCEEECTTKEWMNEE
jgi:hypothetical protein